MLVDFKMNCLVEDLEDNRFYSMDIPNNQIELLIDSSENIFLQYREKNISIYDYAFMNIQNYADWEENEELFFFDKDGKNVKEYSKVKVSNFTNTLWIPKEETSFRTNKNYAMFELDTPLITIATCFSNIRIWAEVSTEFSKNVNPGEYYENSYENPFCTDEKGVFTEN